MVRSWLTKFSSRLDVSILQQCSATTRSSLSRGRQTLWTWCHCSKVIMEKIVTYLFSGKMQLNDLKLEQLLKLMNMASRMLLDELFVNVEDYILDWSAESIVDLFLSWCLAWCWGAPFWKLERYSSHPRRWQSNDNFKGLPLILVKEILRYDERVSVQRPGWARNCKKL